MALADVCTLYACIWDLDYTYTYIVETGPGLIYLIYFVKLNAIVH